ncbi:MAG: DUF3084 domain-containing protein [Candidatus Margulisiibacteriota bacterium]
MLSFEVYFILLLITISGSIAVIGNYIGRTIGRKRISLFGLRPRYTATTITVITGILIAITTFAIILSISQDARTAFFGLEQLKKSLSEKTTLLDKTKEELAVKLAEKDKINSELKKARLEISLLQQSRKKMSREIEVSRKGEVLFRFNETISMSIIQAGPERQKLMSGLQKIITSANNYLVGSGIKNIKGKIVVSESDLEECIVDLQKQQGERLVILFSKNNTLYGEQISAKFKILENQLIYKSGQEIADVSILSSASAAECEQKIKDLLAKTHQSAKAAGILPDPTGAVGRVPYSDIYALAKKVKASNKNTIIKTLASKNIYAIGPLEITFKVFYQ